MPPAEQRLRDASKSGHLQAVVALLAAGADPNINTLAPLHRAAAHGHTACLDALLAGGAIPDMIDGSGWTALQHAAKHGHAECVTLLLGAGASVKRPCAPPAHLAAANGHTDILRQLLAGDPSAAHQPYSKSNPLTPLEIRPGRGHSWSAGTRRMYGGHRSAPAFRNVTSSPQD